MTVDDVVQLLTLNNWIKVPSMWSNKVRLEFSNHKYHCIINKLKNNVSFYTHHLDELAEEDMCCDELIIKHINKYSKVKIILSFPDGI